MVNASVGRSVGPHVPENVPSLRIRQPPVVTVRGLGFSMTAVGGAAARTVYAVPTIARPASVRNIRFSIIARSALLTSNFKLS
jgi:hypothetical protein